MKEHVMVDRFLKHIFLKCCWCITNLGMSDICGICTVQYLIFRLISCFSLYPFFHPTLMFVHAWFTCSYTTICTVPWTLWRHPLFTPQFWSRSRQCSPLASEPTLLASPLSSTKVRRRKRRRSSSEHTASASPEKGKRIADQNRPKKGTLFSFSLHLPDLSSLLDEDGYLSFPDLSEINFMPKSFQHFLPIKSPSLVPCFLFIFFFLLSTSFSVPYALTLSFPLALCLCYLEPKTASLNTSFSNSFQDSSDDEVCVYVFGHSGWHHVASSLFILIFVSPVIFIFPITLHVPACQVKATVKYQATSSLSWPENRHMSFRFLFIF